VKMKLGLLRRWNEAQKVEKLFWSSESVVRGETAEILRRYSEIFLEIKADENWKILDVGCGPTVVSRMIKGGEKYGIDPLMDNFLDKVQDKALLKSFHFLKGVGEWLPFRNNCSDLVVCRNVLDHVQSPDEVLKEIKRVSKDSAILILGVNVYSEFVFRLKKGVEYMGIIGLKERTHPHFFSEKTLQELCSKYFLATGKKIVHGDKARWIKIRAQMPTEQGLRPEMRASVAFLILFFFSNWFSTFFWNVVRLLNQVKAPYFMNESIIIARASRQSAKS
jgi:ubiquinone/menaquinone biosynthesis C-methylase UbiE